MTKGWSTTERMDILKRLQKELGYKDAYYTTFSDDSGTIVIPIRFVNVIHFAELKKLVKFCQDAWLKMEIHFKKEEIKVYIYKTEVKEKTK